MKHNWYLFILLGLAIMSCDGRKSPNEFLKTAVAEFNKKHPQIETYTFYPKSYTEIKTDTLIGPHFRVIIKNYSLMDKTVEIAKTKQHQLQLHRVFESEVLVYNNTKTLVNRHLNVEVFKQIDPNPFWENATLEHVWVNQDTSNNHALNLEITFIDPKSKAFRHYLMTINQKGQQQITIKDKSIPLC